MSIPRRQLDSTLAFLASENITLSSLLLSLLHDRAYTTSAALGDLAANITRLLAAFLRHSCLTDSVMNWALHVSTQRYRECIRYLVDKDNGWHFSALRAKAQQLRNFRIEHMANDMERIAPELWSLVEVLLTANGTAGLEEDVIDEELANSEDEYWEALRVEGFEEKSATQQKRKRKESRRIIRNKQVVVLSILMQNTNQQCNTLQAAFGIFLHSCSTPEKVIKSTACMGLSISLSSIHNAVKSLSDESRETLRDLGQTLLVAYAYDNFDVDLKPLVPAVEKSTDTLLHLTSGIVMQLEHTRIEDLRCSDALWAVSRFNRHAARRRKITLYDIISLHPEPDTIMSGTLELSRRGRFNAWKFEHDLFRYGPTYFRDFVATQKEPETVDQIPLTKLKHVPARAMDINEATVSGNIDAITNLLAQGGICGDLGDGNSADSTTDSTIGASGDLEDIGNHVILIHGDLSTYERVRSVQDRRSLEATPWRRFQFVVFVMGMFHLKMACADAIWRIFIHRRESRLDKSSLFAFAGVMRPHETGKIASGPEFRQMHEIITHTGIAFRLDAWRVEVQRRHPDCTSLEEWAFKKPTPQEIDEIAATLASTHVAGDGLDMYDMRCTVFADRDQQFENSLLLHQYLLLYEEITYAMNMGDVGRLETLFPPWICLFKSTGKHKYANAMMDFMEDLHLVYPEGLRRAVRYNMLVNPTGRPGKFRGADWVVELFNLFIKGPYGGTGSNRTKDRILTESVNVGVYRDSHTNFEENLKLPGLTTKRAEPDLKQTMQKVISYMQEKKANEFSRGRRSEHVVADMIDKGQSILASQMTAAATVSDGTRGNGAEIVENVTEIDLFAELEDLEGLVLSELDLQY